MISIIRQLMNCHVLVKGVFMKLFCVLILLFITVPCFSQAIIIDPTSTTQADDAYTMANMYRMGMGVQKDLNVAFKLNQTAAKLENTDAQLDLGDIHYGGEGTQQSYLKANYWYEKSAEKGNAKAQFNLGYAYLLGQGFSVDYSKARHWFELAVKQEQPSAESSWNNVS